MPRVIKKAVTGRGAVLQFDDGATLSFGPGNPLISEFRADSQLTTEAFVDFKRRVDRFEGASHLARKLALRPLSQSEAKRLLAMKKIDSAVAQEIMADFAARGHLNDAALARNAIAASFRDRPLGQAIMSAKLKKRGIPPEIVTEAIDESYAEAPESELALILLRKRWNALARFDIESARRKAYNFLARRGIGYEAARQAFELMQIESAIERAK